MRKMFLLHLWKITSMRSLPCQLYHPCYSNVTIIYIDLYLKDYSFVIKTKVRRNSKQKLMNKKCILLQLPLSMLRWLGHTLNQLSSGLIWLEKHWLHDTWLSDAPLILCYVQRQEKRPIPPTELAFIVAINVMGQQSLAEKLSENQPRFWQFSAFFLLFFNLS